MRRLGHSLIMMTLVCGTAACDGDDDATDTGAGSTTETTGGDTTTTTSGGTTTAAGESGNAQTRTLSWTLTGLENLGETAVYEGWIIVDGAPVSTGRFSVDDAGVPSLTTADVSADDAAMATAFVLTIEPAEGDDPAPADTHLLAGDFANDVADLGVGHPAALANDFLDASGQYILATPSTMAIADDFSSGVWFLDPAGPAAALVLPELPAGWAFEGWVVGPDGPVSTGRFVDPGGADSDGGGASAGPDPTPPFPGQDFIEPDMDLIGHAVVISIEPEPDNGPAPFTLKPLVDMSVEDLGEGALQSLDNNAAATNPTGSASFE